MRAGGGGVNSEPDADGRAVDAGTPAPPPVRKAHGLRRWVYLALGIVCLMLASVGAFVPVLPCTPWVLAASYFFARSSDWFSRLLRRSPYFGHIIRDWEAHRGIRPWVKVTAVSCVTAFMTLMGIFLNVTWWAKGSAIALAAVGVGFILFVVPTVRVKKAMGAGQPVGSAGV